MTTINRFRPTSDDYFLTIVVDQTLNACFMAIVTRKLLTTINSRRRTCGYCFSGYYFLATFDGQLSSTVFSTTIVDRTRQSFSNNHRRSTSDELFYGNYFFLSLAVTSLYHFSRNRCWSTSEIVDHFSATIARQLLFIVDRLALLASFR